MGRPSSAKWTRAGALTACAILATLATDASSSAEPSAAPIPGNATGRPAAAALEPARVTGRANGVDFVHMLGKHAGPTLAPATGLVGALVALPKGKRAEDYGLDPVIPGIGRLRAPPAKIEAFGFAHPELHLEVAPPLHTTLDRAGQWVLADFARRERSADGAGVLVGVADTGLDVTNPEMLNADGTTRVQWMLDLSLQPLDEFADLEKKFGIIDPQTESVGQGAVLSKRMIDTLLARIRAKTCDEKTGKKCAPSDEIGHGTHVTGIAAARGSSGKYAGIAPSADIVFCRFTRGRGEAIENDDLVRCVQFLFDRADFEKRPMVANLSLGADFGPHDGSFLWEKVIASHVGPEHPGRALLAAAGNSGSIVEMPIHQSVRVTEGATTRVPIRTGGATSGSVQIWITLRAGASLKIGLDGPDGPWIAPVAEGRQAGKNTDEYNAGVIYGSGLEGSPIPQDSRGGVVVWTGAWPAGTYAVTLEGSGMAELYLQGLGDAALGRSRQAVFTNGVREGTVNLPATHPSIIAVGCTVNRPRWTSIAGAEVALRVPILDPTGAFPAPRSRDLDAPSPFRDLIEGEVCWFSSAGPTATGVPKPEIAAPGALVISAMSRTAQPGSEGSVFTNPSCPLTRSGKPDSRCLQIDDMHGIANGTSMSTPVVSGVVALLFQKDPTLTQDKVVALLQAGAHRFRGPAPFDDQAGPGEVDALGTLDALEQMKNPILQLPSRDQSWLTLSSDYVPADGSTPMTAIVELRTEDALHRADFFDRDRLAARVSIDGESLEVQPEIQRRGPGVWVYVWTPPPGRGGSRATFSATFDGEPIVAPRVLAIATDRWNAAYASHAKGSACASAPGSSGALEGWLVAGVAIAVAARRRRHSAASVRSQPCGSQTSSSGSKR
ncbi:MAG: S8 family serine peptidase [Labilithrix sp.]|nr:S8 family serine peptidase [Labilithrix sp.]